MSYFKQNVFHLFLEFQLRVLSASSCGIVGEGKNRAADRRSTGNLTKGRRAEDNNDRDGRVGLEFREAPRMNKISV